MHILIALYKLLLYVTYVCTILIMSTIHKPDDHVPLAVRYTSRVFAVIVHNILLSVIGTLCTMH